MEKSIEIKVETTISMRISCPLEV